MKNSDLFKATFGLYATEVWAMKEPIFLLWLNGETDSSTDSSTGSSTADGDSSTDCVSRKLAIKLFNDYAEEVNQDTDIHEAIEIVMNMPSVTPTQKWIPVSEKLPSDCNEDWVLAQIQEDNGYLWIPCVAEYRKSKDDWFSDANDIGWLRNHEGAFKVIAWMPLPELYKEVDDEDSN